MEHENDNSVDARQKDGVGEVRRRDRIFSELYEWVESAVLAVVAVVLVFTFVARTSMVSGTSMVQTLQHGDMLVVSRLFYDPKPGDIVVITKPNFENEPIVKRVIATSGQSVDIDFVEGIVYVNGEALDEPYTNTPTNKKYDEKFPLTVPQGELFVLGDNRNGSIDSRSTMIGLIDTRYVLGRAYWRVLPASSFGKLYE